MLEIEQKFADADFAALRRQLADWNAHAEESHTESDQYYNAPDRDFAHTDEAFRLRRIGSANFLTYKGPKQPSSVKVRTELEIPLPEGDVAAEQFQQLLTHLGYRPVAIVRKHRQQYRLRRDGFPLTICLDEVDGLGRYAELEILASREQSEAARTVLTETAAALGLQQVERRSYLGLVLARKNSGFGARDSGFGKSEENSGRHHYPVPDMKLAVVETVPPLRQAVNEAKQRGQRIGLVPTMGALHRGHTSLLDAARAETDFVVVSLFVNPTQFGPGEDFTRYPRAREQDLDLCARAGVDLVFAPTVEVMYPPGFRTQVEVTGLQDVLCGASRPGHFRGVATVVLKLFHLVQPDQAYFGQKDAQQVRILQQMVRDLNVPVTIRVLPIVREPDGLALSSRNQYLESDQRRQATVLARALAEARARYEAGERDAAALRGLLEERIKTTPGAVLDYAAVVDADSLEPVTHLQGAALLALAVKFGATRLIDNCLLPSE